jgi:hypothetical protein
MSDGRRSEQGKCSQHAGHRKDKCGTLPITIPRAPEFVSDNRPFDNFSRPLAPQSGQSVRIRIFDHRIEVYFADVLQLACERLRGKEARIDYRHVIWSLVRKPGAFARYVYRDEMFPTITFRKAYDNIQTVKSGIKGDVEYLRILHLAAGASESDVEAALASQLAAGTPVTVDATKAFALNGGSCTPNVPPELSLPAVDLTVYNSLLTQVSA